MPRKLYKQHLFTKLTNLAVILLGLALGLILGYLLIRSNIPWLVVSIALLAALIAWWQTPCIQVELGNSKTTDNKQKRFPCFKRWLWRLSVYLLLVIAVVLGESWWWVKQPIMMNLSSKYNSETKTFDAKQKQAPLPTNYVIKRILWQLGINKPYPKLIEIKAGNFEMGSDKGDEDEKPIHTVSLKRGFQISKNEITFNEYDYYIWSVQQELANLPDKKIIHYSFDEDWGRENRPVINVSWHDAQSYANWLGKETGENCRLPSEAEWEYAARAGTNTVYPWGDKADHNKANYGKDKCCKGLAKDKDQWVNTAPVGSFPTNDFGLNDMHGNVWEWTQDCYKNNYIIAPTNGLAHEEAKCDRRVLRGGSWSGTPGSLRSAFRSRFYPDDRAYDIGFRILCAPPSIEN